jgi:hypothetical protein
MSKVVRDVIASVARSPRRLAGDRRMLMGGSDRALRPAHGWIGTIALSRQSWHGSKPSGRVEPVMGRRRVAVDLIGRVDAKQTSDERKRSSARPEAHTLRAAQIAECGARTRAQNHSKCLRRDSNVALSGAGDRAPSGILGADRDDPWSRMGCCLPTGQVADIPRP